MAVSSHGTLTCNSILPGHTRTVDHVARACVLHRQMLAEGQALALKRDVAFCADGRSDCRASLLAIILEALQEHSGMSRGGCDSHNCKCSGSVKLAT
jgi:hypothetical protein